MRGRKDRIVCKVEGCTAEFYPMSRGDMIHSTSEHEACACGWAGLSHNRHVAAVVIAKKQPEAEHRLVGTRKPNYSS